MRGPKAYIHLDWLVENYRLVRSRVGDKRIMAVVKADGYGHGAVECARILEKEGCDFFAVFTVAEGLELRQAGLQSDILIFSRLDSQLLHSAAENNLILNLAWPDDLDHTLNYLQKNGESPRFHLKVDTGMTRLGMPIEALTEVINRLKQNPGIRCEGIYSHLATADEGDLTFAEFQLKQFSSVLELADSLDYQFKYVHLSNSGAVLNLDQNPFNLVRVGMLLYGAYPSNEVPMELPIQPVMEYRAPVVTVRKVKAGTQISYGGVYSTKSDTTIGVIQCGFADGFPRPWYESGHVCWRGSRYKIAGRVCMDQFMVDFKGQSPGVGEEVLLFGKGGPDELRVEEIAAAIQTTPYVIFTGIHGRTQHIFLID